MKRIIIDLEKIVDFAALEKLCPFGSIEVRGEEVEINSSCRACLLCVKKGPTGAFTFSETVEAEADKDAWRGVTVFVEAGSYGLHPVGPELIGEARILAAKIGHPVYAVLAGDSCGEAAEELLHYGVDTVYLYEAPELRFYRPEPYAAVFEDHIAEVRPSIVLVGGTPLGRSLAPKVAARFKTGLTADCTSLDVQANTDLDQIRPAFGGNIMAHIQTPRHRPQFATVRPKIFPTPRRNSAAAGRILRRSLENSRLASRIEVVESRRKSPEKRIEDAEVLIAAGRGFKKQEDLKLAFRLAELLQGETAGTRSLIEAGWIDPKRQIGLSGRTVKPRLIITCGVSGAVQFAAGMKGADAIISINTDPEAPITKFSHYVIVGDLYEILPRLIGRLEAAGAASRGLPAEERV